MRPFWISDLKSDIHCTVNVWNHWVPLTNAFFVGPYPWQPDQTSSNQCQERLEGMDPKNVGQTAAAAVVFGRPRDWLWWKRETNERPGKMIKPSVSQAQKQCCFSSIVRLKLIGNDLNFDSTFHFVLSAMEIKDWAIFSQFEQEASIKTLLQAGLSQGIV